MKVDLPAQILACSEERHMFFRHGHRFTCAGIAPRARLAVANREGPEATKFNPRTTFKCLRDRFEHDGNHTFHIPPGQVRIFFMKLIDQLGAQHGVC